MAEANQEQPKKKGSKMLVIGAVLAVVLAGGVGGGVWFFMKSKAPAAEEEEVVKAAPAHPPAYLPMDNMVVNLADPGGDRFAQLGITLELADDKAAEKVKSYLPSIRSAILLLVSQRSSEELLSRMGKIKLANDIMVEVARPLGFAEEATEQAKAAVAAASSAASGQAAEGEERPRKKASAHKDNGNPVRGVLFSSFIIQ